MLRSMMKPAPSPSISIHPVADGLPLAPIERFLYRNDGPQHPMVFRVLMCYEGRCHQEKLTEAFRIAIRRQPLLTSYVTSEDGYHTSWQSTDQIPDLLWQPPGKTAEEVAAIPIDPIDLSQSAGVHCRVYPLDDGLMILLDIHHVCCDGQGARQFLAEWFGLYQQMLKSDEIQLASIDYDQLQHRAHYRTINPPIGTWEGLRNLYLTVRGRTVHLQPTISSPAATDYLSEHVFSVEETANLRRELKQSGYSVNDAGLAAAFASFAEQFKAESRRGYLTLMHPVDLRWPSDLKTPACNRVGVSFLRRKQKECQDPRKLLDTVRDQMKYVKQRYVGAEFLRGLASADVLPGGTDRIQRWGWFVPTFQFTCLGDTTRALHYRFDQVDGVINFDGLRLQRISGFMQLGPFLPISLAACETNQRLVLTARSSAQHFTRESAAKFMACFVDKFSQLGHQK